MSWQRVFATILTSGSVFARNQAVSICKIPKVLKPKDPALEEDVRKFYSESIEFGAHPNVDGVMLRTEVTARESKSMLSTIHLRGAKAIVLIIIDLLRAMRLVYRLLYHTIGNRLQLLGIDEEFQQGAQATRKALEVLEKHLQARKQAT